MDRERVAAEPPSTVRLLMPASVYLIVAGDKPVTVPLVPLSLSVAVWPVVSSESSRIRAVEPVMFVTSIMPVKSCMPAASQRQA